MCQIAVLKTTIFKLFKITPLVDLTKAYGCTQNRETEKRHEILHVKKRRRNLTELEVKGGLTDKSGDYDTVSIMSSKAYVYSRHPGMHRSHAHTCRTFSQRHLVHSDTGLPLCRHPTRSPTRCSYRAGSRALCPSHDSRAVSQKGRHCGSQNTF